MDENEALVLMAIKLAKGSAFSTAKLADLIGCEPADVLLAAVSLADQGKINLAVPKTLKMTVAPEAEVKPAEAEAKPTQIPMLQLVTPPNIDDETWEWEASS